jgi:hypothetical protein
VIDQKIKMQGEDLGKMYKILLINPQGDKGLSATRADN